MSRRRRPARRRAGSARPACRRGSKPHVKPSASSSRVEVRERVAVDVRVGVPPDRLGRERVVRARQRLDVPLDAGRARGPVDGRGVASVTCGSSRCGGRQVGYLGDRGGRPAMRACRSLRPVGEPTVECARERPRDRPDRLRRARCDRRGVATADRRARAAARRRAAKRERTRRKAQLRVVNGDRDDFAESVRATSIGCPSSRRTTTAGAERARAPTARELDDRSAPRNPDRRDAPIRVFGRMVGHVLVVLRLLTVGDPQLEPMAPGPRRRHTAQDRDRAGQSSRRQGPLSIR